MVDTAAAPNNRTVVYRGKAQRERPRMSSFGVDPLRQSNGSAGDMPWDAASFKKHNHPLEGAGAAKAASVANAILRKSGDEGKAIRIANATVNKMRRRGRISNKAHAKHSAGLDAKQDVDAATA